MIISAAHKLITQSMYIDLSEISFRNKIGLLLSKSNATARLCGNTEF